MTDQVTITQADRDAAHRLLIDNTPACACKDCQRYAAQAFAKHRIESSPTDMLREGSGASASPTVATHEPSPKGLGPSGECQLAGALKPFADLADFLDEQPDPRWQNPNDEVQVHGFAYSIGVGQLHAARDAYRAIGGQREELGELLDALETASWLLADISPDGLVKQKVDVAIAKAKDRRRRQEEWISEGKAR